jgi:hypothetical protein
MPRKATRSILILGSLLVMIIGAWTIAPLAMGKGEQASAGCELAGPQEPLEMNTVPLFGFMAKTVAMEKEVITCANSSFIVDTETFVEVVERGSKVIDKRVEVTQCFKELRPSANNVGTIKCRPPRDIPIGPPIDRPLRGCTALPSPSDPVEMNTVALKNLVKTIKLDKENFQCGIDVMDVYLFTEVIEKASFFDVKPIEKRYEGIVCRKLVSDFFIDRCNSFPTT